MAHTAGVFGAAGFYGRASLVFGDHAGRRDPGRRSVVLVVILVHCRSGGGENLNDKRRDTGKIRSDLL